eukprot:Rhum_TRINITY_DN14600_c8_g1::Rhum_TRINITY_DN14600_c8_g1_i1::g.102518::m.102518
MLMRETRRESQQQQAKKEGGCARVCVGGWVGVCVFGLVVLHSCSAGCLLFLASVQRVVLKTGGAPSRVDEVVWSTAPCDAPAGALYRGTDALVVGRERCEERSVVLWCTGVTESGV